MTSAELKRVRADIARRLEKAKHWTRQVSCGFLASEIHRIGFHDVVIDCFRFYNLNALNRRELEECAKWCESQTPKAEVSK